MFSLTLVRPLKLACALTLLTLLLTSCATTKTYDCSTMYSRESIAHVKIQARDINKAFEEIKKELPNRGFYVCDDEMRMTRD